MGLFRKKTNTRKKRNGVTRKKRNEITRKKTRSSRKRRGGESSMKGDQSQSLSMNKVSPSNSHNSDNLSPLEGSPNYKTPSPIKRSSTNSGPNPNNPYRKGGPGPKKV